ncbi:MAG: RNA polymerase sigma factor [Cyclobacteriaceae bacterium]
MPKLNNTICDESLFESFFREQAKSLRDFIFYKFGDEEQANDVVQETFIKLWDNCSKVPFEKAKSYIYTIATNLNTSIKRHEKVKLKYHVDTLQTSNEGTNESPEFIVLEKEYMDRLTNAIGSLPERQREAYLLNRVEKKTYVEIAEIMEVSVKAMEKLMHKALLKLRESIGDI